MGNCGIINKMFTAENKGQGFKIKKEVFFNEH